VDVRFPNESAEYREARERLLEQEIELRRSLERVAAARRALPRGGPITENYVFHGPGQVDVRFSELFGGARSLVVYSFMFPRDPADDRPGERDGPCPSCVSFLDQLEGTAFHTKPLLSFVVVAKAPIDRVTAFAAERGWRNLRLYSSAGTSFNRDYFAETGEGHQRPMLNVFERDGGEVRHFWGSELLYAPTDSDQDPRHVGTLEPLWNMLDLTREGRPVDWDEQLAY
jgi:predicted dithiol-disulfide oxidoreductase (DUF899 family)